MSVIDETPTTLANLRDVGLSLPPGLVSPGILLRSDAPAAGDVEPAAAAWPPTAVIDLREPVELSGDHPLAGRAVVHAVPLLGEAALAAAAPADPDHLLEVYRALVAPDAATRLMDVMRHIAETDGPVLVHCAAGKDRTGVSIALALRLADVDRTSVAEEYHLTSLVRDGLLARLSRHHLGPTTPPWQAAPDVLLTSAAGIDAVLDIWDAWQGGVVGWYLDHGGDLTTLARLRERLRP